MELNEYGKVVEITSKTYKDILKLVFLFEPKMKVPYKLENKLKYCRSY